MHMVPDIARTKECQLCAMESNRTVIKIPFFQMHRQKKKNKKNKIIIMHHLIRSFVQYTTPIQENVTKKDLRKVYFRVFRPKEELEPQT